MPTVQCIFYFRYSSFICRSLIWIWYIPFLSSLCSYFPLWPWILFVTALLRSLPAHPITGHFLVFLYWWVFLLVLTFLPLCLRGVFSFSFFGWVLVIVYFTSLLHFVEFLRSVGFCLAHRLLAETFFETSKLCWGKPRAAFGPGLTWPAHEMRTSSASRAVWGLSFLAGGDVLPALCELREFSGGLASQSHSHCRRTGHSAIKRPLWRSPRLCVHSPVHYPLWQRLATLEPLQLDFSAHQVPRSLLGFPSLCCRLETPLWRWAG